MVSCTISLPSLGYFSPFPHGTSSLSVAEEYLALEDGPPGFIQDFSCPALLGYLLQREPFFSLTGLSPSMVNLSRLFQLKTTFLTLRRMCTSTKVEPATPDVQQAHPLT